MEINQSSPLLGGLSPSAFMRRHWQRKPLLVRQAWPGVRPPIDRAGLFALAAQEGVESRLLTRFDGKWRLRHGPLVRRALPAVAKPGWTLLVQGLDLHLQAAHAMLEPFRFVPEAQFDDLMISYATDGGGVGPHLDAYDVFLLQVHGRRRWRIGKVADTSCIGGLPVRILQRFEPSEEWVLEPGDMLYLPPLWGHDGVAEGECMTCSVGFRATAASDLARQLLVRVAEDAEPKGRETIYRDAAQRATDEPGRVPQALQQFASAAVQRCLSDPRAIAQALGCLVTEPKAQVWFEGVGRPHTLVGCRLRLDRRSRMVYDERAVYLNGEAFHASGADARLMRQLADARHLEPTDATRLSAGAKTLVIDWVAAGWLHADATGATR